MTTPSDPRTSADFSLTLSLLGSVEATRRNVDGATLEVLSAGKPLALLAFLHCTPAQTASREQLIELLWSDAEPEAARHTLRQTLWYVRRKLGSDPLASAGDGVRLVAHIDSDRSAFLAALDADDPAAALDCYRGEFFPGFAAPGGAGFEHWADLERARLRALFFGAATRVVRDRLSKGRARDAIIIARRTRELIPRHQGAWRLLLESHLAADDQIGVTFELERLERWLADEEHEPDPATAQLIKLVRAGKSEPGETPSRQPATLHAELVGRESAFADLLAACEQAKRGHTRHVHISAPAGFGKSRLLEGFAARLRSSRGRVVSVRATIAERSLPYAFAAQLAAALVKLRGASAVSPDTARTLVGLAPSSSNYLNAEPDRSTGEDALRRRSLALTELAATIAHESPLVLLIDDVHWMDASSRTVLAALATRVTDAALLVVTAARPGDPFVATTPDARRLSLSALSLDDVGALVMSLGRLPSEPWADAFVQGLLSATAGSPLLVMETLQLVMEKQQLQLIDQTWTTPDRDALLATLHTGNAMQQRVSALPVSARDALLRIAVAGTTVPDRALIKLIPSDGYEALALLETRGLLARVDDGWCAAHDEIAALVDEMASDVDRRRAHDAMALHLEQTAGDDVSLLLRAAWHRARAQDTAALDQVLTRAVRSANATGDLRAIRSMASEALGSAATTTDVDALVQRLPWTVRTRPARWMAGAAIVVSMASVVVAGVSLRGAASVSPVRLATFSVHRGDRTLFVALRDVTDDLARDEPIDLPTVSAPLRGGLPKDIAISGRLPDGSYVGAGLRTTDKQVGMDIFRVTPDGAVSTLIGGRDDQVAPRLSPDGKHILYASGEWHPTQHAELAVFDVATRTSTRLTVSENRERNQQWSKEGTRFAYVSSPPAAGDAQVCWRAVDTLSVGCLRLPEAFIPASIVAWQSENTVLVTADRPRAPGRALLRVSLDDGTTSVVDTTGTEYVADPAGRVVLCHCRVRGFSDAVMAAFSPSSAWFKRPLFVSGAPLSHLDDGFAVWEPSSAGLTAIHVRGPMTASLRQGVAFSLEGVDMRGAARSVPIVRWSSPDSALVESVGGGVFRMRAAGAARIVASAAGLFTDTLRLAIRDVAARTVFQEDWRAPLATRWKSMGFPAPEIVSSKLRVNGDGYLTSGVVSLSTINAASGAGVRAMVRVPLTETAWQSIHIILGFIASDRELEEWRDASEGSRPVSWNARTLPRECVFGAPRAEGGEFMRLIAMTAAGTAVTLQRPAPVVTDAQWHAVTLQVFDDGRCGLAIDGQPVAVSENALRVDEPFRVLLEGQSQKTTVEVGAVEAWSGIKGDIDWSILVSPAAPPRRRAGR